MQDEVEVKFETGDTKPARDTVSTQASPAVVANAFKRKTPPQERHGFHVNSQVVLQKTVWTQTPHGRYAVQFGSIGLVLSVVDKAAMLVGFEGGSIAVPYADATVYREEKQAIWGKLRERPILRPGDAFNIRMCRVRRLFSIPVDAQAPQIYHNSEMWGLAHNTQVRLVAELDNITVVVCEEAEICTYYGIVGVDVNLMHAEDHPDPDQVVGFGSVVGGTIQLNRAQH